MSQCEGVNIYASGDYLLDERQGYLCNTIERLRAHMVTLKERLEEEKMLLSELKAETEYLSMQQADNMQVCEEYYPSSYQGKPSVCQSSMRPPINPAFAGELDKAKKSVEEPKQKFDRVEYVYRLKEIDNLCKEEMLRMNSVVEQMEPLKQIASDWMLENKLKEISGATDPKDMAPFGPTPVIEPASYSHPVFNGELIVLPPERIAPPATVLMPESEGATNLDPHIRVQAPIVNAQIPSKPKLELKSNREPQLKLDCMLKPKPQKNAATATDRKGQSAKARKEKKPEISSSEASLSSLEALKEKNITLIEVADNKDEKRNAKKLEKKALEDWKSTVSGKTSKSAISLESIQRAFANHHKKKLKRTGGKEALSVVHMTRELREKLPLKKHNSQEDQTKKDKLLAYLDPSAKKIVKNWVMVGKEGKKTRALADRKQERPKKCTLNIGRDKDAELSLCEDDVINKFLYDEEGYVYTPLFVSETEGESSSDTSSVG